MLRAKDSEDTAIECLLPWGKRRPGVEKGLSGKAQSPYSKCIALGLNLPQLQSTPVLLREISSCMSLTSSQRRCVRPRAAHQDQSKHILPGDSEALLLPLDVEAATLAGLLQVRGGSTGIVATLGLEQSHWVGNLPAWVVIFGVLLGSQLLAA